MIPRRDPIEELSLLLQRPPPRQFVTSALSISSPGGASAKWKGKQRAEAPPPIVDPSRLSLPPIEVHDPIPSSPRIQEEDELSSDEEPLARTRPPRIPVNPPVILPDMHYAIPEKPPDTTEEDEIISVPDSDDEENSLQAKPPDEQEEILDEINELHQAMPELEDDYKVFDRLGTGE